MRAACYCRVSTDKDEQIESLEKQIEFFVDFVKNKGHELTEIYADEGISGKQLKNRIQFIRMIKDAEAKRFDILYVKDVSRFARNVEDFIHNIRKIKMLGLDVCFITHNLSVQEGSEFYLTMLALLAQEESARLSEKVKFGKNVTAKKGRVPSFVFGYDKVDNYTLTPNPMESEIVKRIFELFVNRGYGTARIATYLNDNMVLTKKNRQYNWYQKVVIQILRNEIYTGKIINRKSEVIDFITGKRREIEKENQIVVERPEIRIISDDIFQRAQEILEDRRDSFKLLNKRESTKYPFSNLIKCSECGYSFRRLQRLYTEGGKLYKIWTCSVRNAKGVNACCNKTVVDEDELLDAIGIFMKNLVKGKSRAVKLICSEIGSLIESHNQDIVRSQVDVRKELKEFTREKEKYMDMYKNEVISIDELKKYTRDLNEKIQKLKSALELSNNTEAININVETAINNYFKKMQDIVDSGRYDNEFLKSVIEKIIVYPDGIAKIILKIDNQHSLNFDIPIDLLEIPLEEIVPVADNQT